MRHLLFLLALSGACPVYSLPMCVDGPFGVACEINGVAFGGFDFVPLVRLGLIGPITASDIWVSPIWEGNEIGLRFEAPFAASSETAQRGVAYEINYGVGAVDGTRLIKALTVVLGEGTPLEEEAYYASGLGAVKDIAYTAVAGPGEASTDVPGRVFGISVKASIALVTRSNPGEPFKYASVPYFENRFTIENTTPEPSTLMLTAAGIAALLWRQRKHQS